MLQNTHFVLNVRSQLVTNLKGASRQRVQNISPWSVFWTGFHKVFCKLCVVILLKNIKKDLVFVMLVRIRLI